MRIGVSRLHHPVTALGPGTRAGVWMQGCSIGCAGCVSQDTWDFRQGNAMEVDDLLAWLARINENHGFVDGLTISGGEPTEQNEALFELLRGVDRMRRNGTFTGDVLCYSGRDLVDFVSCCPWADELIDAVVTGPFEMASPTDLLWRGSANQRIVPLTERGRRLYEPYVDAVAEVPPLQVAVDDGQVWMIGIPRRGDLRRIESMLRNNGIQLETVSWRPQ